MVLLEKRHVLLGCEHGESGGELHADLVAHGFYSTWMSADKQPLVVFVFQHQDIRGLPTHRRLTVGGQVHRQFHVTWG